VFARRSGWIWMQLHSDRIWTVFFRCFLTSFKDNGLADVCLNGEWQIIDKTGELVYFK